MQETLTRPRWRWPTLLLSIVVGLAMLAGCVGLDTQQRKWIFQARATPDAVDGRSPGLDDVWIELPNASDGHARKLHALWAAGPTPAAPVLLYLHGVRRDVDASAFRIRQMQSLGFGVLAVDYRGFGRSSDALPSETSVDEDARAAWAWLAAKHPSRDRYLFGHSLGGAVAVRLATEVDDAKGLIVEGTFTSMPEMVGTMKWGWLPIGPLITQRFDSAARIARLKVPVLVVHGAADTLVPPELGRALYERAPSPKRFVLVPGGTHYSTNGIGRTQYQDALRELFGVGA